MLKTLRQESLIQQRVRGEIDQISTNTLRYTTCCAASVYMFVYILIGAPIVPLNTQILKLPMLGHSSFCNFWVAKMFPCRMFHRISFCINSLNFSNYQTNNSNNWTYEDSSGMIFQMKLNVS